MKSTRIAIHNKIYMISINAQHFIVFISILYETYVQYHFYMEFIQYNSYEM